MFNLLTGLKRLFSGKKDKAKEELPTENTNIETAATEPAHSEPAPPKPATVEPKPADGERPQIPCRNCGAPNDNFVRICWLCKKEV